MESKPDDSGRQGLKYESGTLPYLTYSKLKYLKN